MISGVAPNRSCVINLILPLAAYATALVFNGPGANLLLLTCIVCTLLLWLGILIWRDLVDGPLRWPTGIGPALMAAMLAWMFLSMLWSSWQQTSFFYAFIVGAMPLGYLLWLMQADAEALWDRLWIGSLLLTLAAGVWGLADYIATARRIDGPFRDANAFGALFYLFFLPAFFRYLAMRTMPAPSFWRLRGYEAAIAVLLAALFATYSRGAIGALVLMLPLVLAITCKRYGRAAIPAMLTVAMIGGAAYLAVTTYPDKAVDRNVLALSDDSSLHHRLYMWRSTWEIYRDNPILGTGLGTYKTQYSAYRDPRESGTTGDLAHNDYLQMLQEGGPVLLALLLATGIMTVWLLFRSFRLSGEAGLSDTRRQRLLESCGLLLGVLALFAHAMLNFVFYVLPLSLLAGLFLAQAYRLCVGVSYRKIRLPVRAMVSRTALVSILVLPVTALVIDGLAATVFLRQPPAVIRNILAPDIESAYKLAQTMTALRPGNTVPALYLAGINHRISTAAEDPGEAGASARRARDYYVKALTVTEHNAPALTEFAQVLESHPNLHAGVPASLSNDPETLLRQAIRVQPAYEPAYLVLARLYEQRGDLESAHALLTEDAMVWFTSRSGYQQERVRIVEQAMDLALQLGKTESARALATTMLANVPDHTGAQEILRSLAPDSQSRLINIDNGL